MFRQTSSQQFKHGIYIIDIHLTCYIKKSSFSKVLVDADKQHPRTVEKYRNFADVNPSYILLSQFT